MEKIVESSILVVIFLLILLPMLKELITIIWNSFAEIFGSLFAFLIVAFVIVVILEKLRIIK
mgnify:CR=1 FL=1